MSRKKAPVDIDEFDCTMTTYLDSPDLVEYEVEFHDFAKNNNIDKMQLLINKKVDINCVNKLERTAAHFAAAGGHEEALMVLKEANADLELEDKCGMTPLLWAGYYGHVPAVKLMVQYFKCRPDATNKAGMNLLHLAAMNGQVVLLDFINANVSRLNPAQKDKKGRTALHIAAQGGFADVIRMLFRFRRVDLNAVDHKGRTALHYACEKGYVDCVNVLLDHKADFDLDDYDQKTPLYLAVETGQVEIIDRLLDFEHFPAMVHRFKTDKSLLHVAAALNHAAVITMFAHRCKLEAQDEVRNTALHQAILSRNTLCVQELLRSGANVNAVTMQGDTPLHLACQQNEPQIVYLLLQCTDVDLFKTNRRGKTALYVAAQGSFVGIVDMIIRAQLLHIRHINEKVRQEQEAAEMNDDHDSVDEAKQPRMRRQVTFADDLESEPETATPVQEEQPAGVKALSLAAFKRQKDEEIRGIRERRKLRVRVASEPHSEYTADSFTPNTIGTDTKEHKSPNDGSSRHDSVDVAALDGHQKEQEDHGEHGEEHHHHHHHHHHHDENEHHHHHHSEHHDELHSEGHHEGGEKNCTHLPRTKFSRRSMSGRILSPEKRLHHRRLYIDMNSAASTPYDLYHDGLTRSQEVINFDMMNSMMHFVAKNILGPDSWRDLASIWMFTHEQMRIISQQEVRGSQKKAWKVHAYRMLRIWFSSLPESEYVVATKLLVDAVEQVTAQKQVKKLKKHLFKAEAENTKKVSKVMKTTGKNATAALRRGSAVLAGLVKIPSFSSGKSGKSKGSSRKGSQNDDEALQRLDSTEGNPEAIIANADDEPGDGASLDDDNDNEDETDNENADQIPTDDSEKTNEQPDTDDEDVALNQDGDNGEQPTDGEAEGDANAA